MACRRARPGPHVVVSPNTGAGRTALAQRPLNPARLGADRAQPEAGRAAGGTAERDAAGPASTTSYAAAAALTTPWPLAAQGPELRHLASRPCGPASTAGLTRAIRPASSSSPDPAVPSPGPCSRPACRRSDGKGRSGTEAFDGRGSGNRGGPGRRAHRQPTRATSGPVARVTASGGSDPAGQVTVCTWPDAGPRREPKATGPTWSWLRLRGFAVGPGPACWPNQAAQAETRCVPRHPGLACTPWTARQAPRPAARARPGVRVDRDATFYTGRRGSA